MNTCENIIEKVCPYCGLTITGKHSVYANHVRWCKSNPDIENNIKHVIETSKIAANNRFGVLSDFEVECDHCHTKFIVKERPELFPKKKKYFCCRSCANSREQTDEIKRKKSESVKNTIQENIKNGKLPSGCSSLGKNTPFKTFKHNTWDGNIVFLRSSYENEYAIKLDSQKIHYEVESLRIGYYDSVQSKYRYALPDFYIPSKNMIIEVKSKFTYKRQNVLEKTKAYIKNGYNVILVLDKVDYNIKDPEIDLPKQFQETTIYDI